MATMMVMYRTPKDPQAFDRHYSEVHVPMARQLPGLLSYEMSDGPVTTVTGPKDVYMVATLRFPSIQAIREAFASDIGKACAADRHILAPNDSDLVMLIYDEQDA